MASVCNLWNSASIFWTNSGPALLVKVVSNCSNLRWAKQIWFIIVEVSSGACHFSADWMTRRLEGSSPSSSSCMAGAFPFEGWGWCWVMRTTVSNLPVLESSPIFLFRAKGVFSVIVNPVGVPNPAVLLSWVPKKFASSIKRVRWGPMAVLITFALSSCWCRCREMTSALNSSKNSKGQSTAWPFTAATTSLAKWTVILYGLAVFKQKNELRSRKGFLDPVIWQSLIFTVTCPFCIVFKEGNNSCNSQFSPWVCSFADKWKTLRNNSLQFSENRGRSSPLSVTCKVLSWSESMASIALVGCTTPHGTWHRNCSRRSLRKNVSSSLPNWVLRYAASIWKVRASIGGQGNNPCISFRVG